MQVQNVARVTLPRQHEVQPTIAESLMQQKKIVTVHAACLAAVTVLPASEDAGKALEKFDEELAR